MVMMGALAWPWASSPAPQPDAAYKYAYAYHTCAPWDGAAIAIVLQKTAFRMPPAQQLPASTYPQLNITLWTGDPAVGSWIDLPEIGNTGYVGEFTGANQAVRGTGRVRLTRLTTDRIEGEADFRFKGQPEKMVRFSAPILKYSPMCG